MILSICWTASGKQGCRSDGAERLRSIMLESAYGTSATSPARSHSSALQPFADMLGIEPHSRD
jgi:hypothetical protein